MSAWVRLLVVGVVGAVGGDGGHGDGVPPSAWVVLPTVTPSKVPPLVGVLGLGPLSPPAATPPPPLDAAAVVKLECAGTQAAKDIARHVGEDRIDDLDFVSGIGREVRSRVNR